MDAIKKKMQAMKLEKDNAMDKADTSEGQARDANLRADKVLTTLRIPFTTNACCFLILRVTGSSLVILR